MTMEKTVDKIFQPEDSYVPQSFLKQKYPNHLLEYYERALNITGYSALKKEDE